MKVDRTKRARQNISTSLIGQIVAIICGFVIPRIMIGTFGSEAYGATASISQFLAYITLLEGGIGGVARAALYKPLAENNAEKISQIIEELRHFFRIIAYIFLAYVLILALTFKSISNVTVFDQLTTFLLVVVISISTFAQYYIGITHSVLLQAAQRTYITNYVTIGATVMNTILTLILVKLGCNLLTVKLVSGGIFVMRPFALQMYVNRRFQLVQSKRSSEVLLKDKWTGLGQHIAFFLHSNTDIMVLTVFANLQLVAVYSVYNMIIAQIQNLTASFTSGMEALFGEMIAKKEQQELDETFSKYETMISVVAVILLATTALLIIPFVKLYTAGISDAEYVVPAFALLMTLASLLYCLRIPYHAVVIAAGHFRQTKLAAYGEAILNIGLSIVLVVRFGLIGVAIGTLVATAFRFAFYVMYLSKNIIYRKVSCFMKRLCLNAAVFSLVMLAGRRILSALDITNYMQWVLCGVATVVAVTIITIMCNGLFYGKELLVIVKQRLRR